MVSPGSEVFDLDAALDPIRGRVLRWVASLGLIAGAGMLATATVRGEAPLVLLPWGLAMATWIAVLATQSRAQSSAAALHSFLLVALFPWLVQLREGLLFPPNASVFVVLPVIAGFTWNTRGTFVVAALSLVDLSILLYLSTHLSTVQKFQAVAEFGAQIGVIAVVVYATLHALEVSAGAALAHRARFQRMIESSPDAIIAVDEDQQISLFNPRAQILGGVELADALGQSLAELPWPGVEVTERVTAAARTLGPGDQLPAFEVESPLPDQMLEVILSRVSSEIEGRHFLLTIRDVTERSRAAAARAQFEAHLRESRTLESLGRLAGGVAHDFNNLLTIIIGSVDILRDPREGDEEAESDLEAIEEAARRAAELTSQLLAVGRKQVLEPEVLCPNRVLEGLRPLLRRLLPSNIALTIKLDPGLWHTRADESRLEQVVVNLVANARDAMPQGGAILVETSNTRRDEGVGPDNLPAGDYVQIAVSDSGVGMSAETAARVFEPFFSTKGTGGTGLGLATVQGIVTQSEGHICVTSEVGQGTCFRVYFPQSEAATSESSEQAPGAGEHRSLRVLLAEDQDSVGAAVERMLEVLGHTVVRASGAESAIELYDAENTRAEDTRAEDTRAENTRAEDTRAEGAGFDLLITDLIMGGSSGTSLATTLHDRNPDLTVLYISGYAEDNPVLQSVREQRLSFLAKPFTLRALELKVGSLFGEA